MDQALFSQLNVVLQGPTPQMLPREQVLLLAANGKIWTRRRKWSLTPFLRVSQDDVIGTQAKRVSRALIVKQP